MTYSFSTTIVTRTNEVTYTNTMYVHIHDTHMYTYIRKYRARKSFYDKVISLKHIKQEFL